MTTTTPSTPQSVWLTKSDRTGQTLMETLFDRLSGMYVGRWQSAFKTDTDVTNWANAWALGFESKGITPRMIKRGLDNCMEMFDWPPSLSEFIKACTTPSRDEQFAPIQDPSRMLTRHVPFNPEMVAKISTAVKTPEDAGDHLRWVRKILKNPERYCAYSQRMAREVALERGITV